MRTMALMLMGGALLAAPALSQTAAAPAAAPATAPNVAAGANVVDTSGNPVGTIESVSGGTAVLSTGTAKASVPTSSFAAGPKGLVIGVTKADLEAQVAKASAPANVVVGMMVSGPQGNPVGKVDAVSGDLVTVATANTKAQLPRSAFAAGPNGGLVIGLTAAQLDAAAKSAGATPGTPGS